MALENDVRNDASEIIDDDGVSVTVYAEPTYTLDAEGYSTITLDTAISSVAIVFSNNEEATSEEEGIDLQLTYMMYLKYDVATITERSLIKYNDEYYKVRAIEKNPLGDNTVNFWEILVERLKDQDKVS